MQLHNISGKHKKKKTVGRGGKRGTYSGKGMKGQKARAGHRIRPAVRDSLKQIPKLRGYAFKSAGTKTRAINLVELERHFRTGEMVSPKTLLEKGLVEAFGSRLPVVKILGEGKLTKNVTVRKCTLSKSARAAIEKAGGKVL